MRVRQGHALFTYRQRRSVDTNQRTVTYVTWRRAEIPSSLAKSCRNDASRGGGTAAEWRRSLQRSAALSAETGQDITRMANLPAYPRSRRSKPARRRSRYVNTAQDVATPPSSGTRAVATRWRSRCGAIRMPRLARAMSAVAMSAFCMALPQSTYLPSADGSQGRGCLAHARIRYRRTLIAVVFVPALLRWVGNARVARGRRF